MSPVFRSIGLGLWHSVCSCDGAAMMSRTSAQNGFPDVSPKNSVVHVRVSWYAMLNTPNYKLIHNYQELTLHKI